MPQHLIDQYGRPIESTKARELRARFDLAQTTRDNERHWAAADGRSARTALTPDIRKRMRDRSRYEAENSAWYSGILSTAANHVVGRGPRLQVLTDNAEGNRRLERAWGRWSKAIGLTRQLRIMFQSYWRDGEAFALRSRRESLYPIKLDVRVYESEQVQSPYDVSALGDPYVDDGIRFIPNSETIEYFFLDHHPTDPHYVTTWRGEWKPFTDVIHLYRPTRAGQVRGIPRAAPGLPLLAVMRRFEIATVHAAESAALHAMVITSQAGPNGSAIPSDPVDFESIFLERNMATFLPEGFNIQQIKPEHPATTMEMFIRQMLMHFCRSMNIPYGLAAGTSKDSNFSSHKGDVKNLWEPEVRAEQDLLESAVVDKEWAWFLEEALLAGLLDGMPPMDQIDHQWFWDGIPPLDETDAANAKRIRMQSGISTIIDEYAADGRDFETSMAKADGGLNLPPGTYKQAVFNAVFPAFGQSQPAGMAAAAEDDAAIPATPSGEYTQLGQRTYNNVQRRIETTVQQLANGEITETMARVRLETNGLNQARIDRLIEIASDGQVTPAEMTEVQS